MDYRDDLIRQLNDLPAERTAEHKRFMDEQRNGPNSEKPLCSYTEAIAYARRHRDMMALAQIGADASSQFHTATHMMRASLQDEARKAMPAALTAAIRDMEAEVEKRKALGFVPVSFSQIPGGEIHMVAKHRTEADVAATTRAEQALGRLQGLALVPGDLDQPIRDV